MLASERKSMHVGLRGSLRAFLLFGLGAANPLAAQEIDLSSVTVLTSSSYPSETDEFGAQRLFDQDFSSSGRWVSDGKTQQSWILIDFGKPHALTHLTMHLSAPSENGQILRDFDVQTGLSRSPFDSEWSTVASVRGNQSIGPEVRLDGAMTRFLRVKILDAGADNYARVSEIEVHGAPQSNAPRNIAPLARLVTASSVMPSMDNAFVASRVRDNDRSVTSRWISDGRSEESWLAFDLGAHYEVSRVTIFHSGVSTEALLHNTRDFDLQVAAAWSPHDGSWKSVERVRDNARYETTIHLGRQTRFLRIKILDAGVDDHARISEVVIHGVRVSS